jgi:hypothetical protein
VVSINPTAETSGDEYPAECSAITGKPERRDLVETFDAALAEIIIGARVKALPVITAVNLDRPFIISPTL